MALLEINQLTVQYGGTRVLESVTARVEAGEKIGLIGANGAGKTTLVRAVMGDLEADGGSVRLQGPTAQRIAYVSQHMPSDIASTALEFIIEDALALRDRLRAFEREMADCDPERLSSILERYAEARERYDAEAGDDAEHRALALLAQNGIGYLADTPVADLSGGEKNRIQILRGLIRRPEMLILDEPGNHLDAWGLAWLEGFLSSYPAAILVISHNRYLLDRVVTRVWELRGRRITSYTGNYSAYRSATLRQAVKSASDARADKKHLERLEAMVAYLASLARARPDPAIGKRLRARRTQLRRARERSREAPSLDDGTVRIGFGPAAAKADIALDIQGFSFGYGERMLFRAASARILVGERVALIGPNGSGKTTLLERIIDDAHWDHPSLRLGPSMKVGYCAQTRHVFRAEASVEDNLRDLGRYTRDYVFGLISRYLFEYRDLSRHVGTLSGGEINRLQLARAELLGANFLILDEPTNHLDIASREAVEEALLRFSGTVLIVSHDRYLLDSVVNRVLYLVDEQIESFDGGFSDFWYSIGRWEGPKKGEHRQTASASEDTVEARLLALEARKIEIERRLKHAYSNGDLKTAKALSRDLEKTQRLYDKLYAEWN